MTGGRFAISEISTPRATLEEEIVAYAAAGVEGIGIWESKLPSGRDDELADKLGGSGLRATICVPTILSILPGRLVEGPDDPKERVCLLCASIHRLAAFDPVACLCLTGPLEERTLSEVRPLVTNGLRRIAAAAGEVGIGIGVEPIRSSISADWSFVTDIPQTLEFLDDVGASNLQIMFDTWHLWDTPDILGHIERYADRFVGVHVSDWRNPTRSWCDHVLPGDGVIDFPAIFGALEAAGYDGWYDLEIFSDDGTYGNDFPDSLWKLTVDEFARRGKEAFSRMWHAPIE